MVRKLFLKLYNAVQFIKNVTKDLEMFYLNTIEQLFILLEQLDRLEVCVPYSRLVSNWNINTGGIPKFKVESK